MGNIGERILLLGRADLPDVTDKLIWKIYSIYSTSKSFVGEGTLLSLDRIVANQTRPRNGL